jgi:hypothetical protein
MPLARLPLPKPAPLARAIALVVVACASLGAVGGVAAQQPPRPPPPEAPPRAREGDSDALSDAVRRIERANRGQVLSAERMEYDGRPVNRIKVVDDEGRVRIYMDEPPPAPRRQQEPPRSRGDD